MRAFWILLIVTLFYLIDPLTNRRVSTNAIRLETAVPIAVLIHLVQVGLGVVRSPTLPRPLEVTLAVTVVLEVIRIIVVVIVLGVDRTTTDASNRGDVVSPMTAE